MFVFRDNVVEFGGRQTGGQPQQVMVVPSQQQLQYAQGVPPQGVMAPGVTVQGTVTAQGMSPQQRMAVQGAMPQGVSPQMAGGGRNVSGK